MRRHLALLLCLAVVPPVRAVDVDRPHPGPSMRFLLGGGEFGPALEKDLRSARGRTYLSTLSFEADPAGRSAADALLACRAPDRRLVIDSYSRHFVNDRSRRVI